MSIGRGRGYRPDNTAFGHSDKIIMKKRDEIKRGSRREFWLLFAVSFFLAALILILKYLSIHNWH